MNTSPVTVVIPALNAVGTLGDQLEALDRQVTAIRFTVIVVDNGSTDDTAKFAGGYPATRYSINVVSEPRRGINIARNAGVAAAPDGCILICDADDIVNDDWIETMLNRLRPGLWVGGELDYQSLNSPDTLALWDAPLRTSHGAAQPFVDTGFGGNCAFQRSMWADLGGFDDTLSGAGDENEFFYRAWNAGYALQWSPESVIRCRLRTGLKAMVRQRYRKGKSVAYMATRSGGQLMTREKRTVVVKSWLWLGANAPFAAVDSARRIRWLRVGAFRLGQLIGASCRIRAKLARR
jgi:glycosyltransferase involved in cell wall biosynthesis